MAPTPSIRTPRRSRAPVMRLPSQKAPYREAKKLRRPRVVLRFNQNWHALGRQPVARSRPRSPDVELMFPPSVAEQPHVVSFIPRRTEPRYPARIPDDNDSGFLTPPPGTGRVEYGPTTGYAPPSECWASVRR
jgi:hypothetical protein